MPANSNFWWFSVIFDNIGPKQPTLQMYHWWTSGDVDGGYNFSLVDNWRHWWTTLVGKVQLKPVLLSYFLRVVFIGKQLATSDDVVQFWIMSVRNNPHYNWWTIGDIGERNWLTEFDVSRGCFDMFYVLVTSVFKMLINIDSLWL